MSLLISRRPSCILAVAVLTTVLPAQAFALCCNQPGSTTLTPAQMNANQLCAQHAASCEVGEQSLDRSQCEVVGCDLDFGSRPVAFTGPFRVGAAALSVRARTIQFLAAIDAAPDGVVELGATGSQCPSPGGDIVLREPIDVSGSGEGRIRLTAGCRIEIESGAALSANGASGGTIEVRAGTSLRAAAPLRAVGSAGDGGDIALVAGDDVLAQGGLDVRSTGEGDGGTVTVRAGDAGLAGLAPGGSLTLTGDAIADSGAEKGGESGNSGGDITLTAAGPLTVASGATVQANGDAPDGEGGSLTVDAGDPLAGVVTDLDGDVTMSGPIVLRGASGGGEDESGGSGGFLMVRAGRSLTFQGRIDVSGGEASTGGIVSALAGTDLSLEAPIVGSGRGPESGGGAVELKAGLARVASLTVAGPIDVSANDEATAGDVRVAGCSLAVRANVRIDAQSLGQGREIRLAAPNALTIEAGSDFLANDTGRITLFGAPDTRISIDPSARFDPAPVVTVLPPGAPVFPPCPVCGDGIRQPGEPCDPGAAADGACCVGDCHGFVCDTPTPTPTVTPSATGPTPSRTPARTATPARPAATATAAATPGLPQVDPRAILGCAHALGRGASRLAAIKIAVLEACSLDAFGCTLLRPSGPERAPCLARAARRCATRRAKLTAARRAFGRGFTLGCAGDPPALPFVLLRARETLGFEIIDGLCRVDVGVALTSPGAVLRCVESGSCAAEQALAVAVPRAGNLLGLLFDVSGGAVCVPLPPDDVDAIALDAPLSRAARRCLRATAAGARRLFTRGLAVARGCVDGLLGCRLAGGGGCGAVAARCRAKLAALADDSSGVRARLASTVTRACDGMTASALTDREGLGFATVADRCDALGAPPPTDPAGVTACVARAYGCAAASVLRRALPLVDAELERVGLALGDTFACGAPVPPTPSGAPTPLATPTSVPTAVYPGNPTATSTPSCGDGVLAAGEQCDLGDRVEGDGCDAICRFERLVPGGGGTVSDCVAEWAVIAPGTDPPLAAGRLPSIVQRCADGDPSCDADGTADGACIFRVAVCLANRDPNLPDCAAPSGVATYTLQIPQLGSSDPVDAANAMAVLDAFTRLTTTAVGGSRGKTFTFDPPLVVTMPDNCTAPALVTVERRGLEERSERFRARAISVASPASATGLDDRDMLVLTCVAPPT